jgi:hypothetical protein
MSMGNEAFVSEIVADVTAAAVDAVKDVPAEIEKLGASPGQGRAIAEAMRLFLLRDSDYRERARKVLIEGGFMNGNVEKMLTQIETGTR